MAVLVIADHDNASLSDATHKTVTAAAQFGGDVDVLVAGSGAGDVAAAAAKISGVRKVLHAEGDAYAKQLAEAMVGGLHLKSGQQSGGLPLPAVGHLAMAGGRPLSIWRGSR